MNVQRRRALLDARACSVHAPTVCLDASASGDEPKWMQIAYEGQWSGHHMGAFSFERWTFERIVENFKRHPQYDGKTGLVAFDFNHASEMAPTEGSIPSEGTPAAAWVRDLEVRNGPDGKAQLWSLTEYLEPARTYVREGKIKWVSVAVWFDAVDPETGESIGPTLTSVAFTNQPFLRGLPAIAAAVRPFTQEESVMDPKLIAALLGIEEDASEPTIKRRLSAARVLCSHFDVTDEASAKKAVVALSAETLETSANMVQLEEGEDLDAMRKELSELRDFKASSETAAAEADVDVAIASYNLPKQTRAALLLQRKGDPAGFAKDYPPAEPGQAHLTQDLTGSAATHSPAPAGNDPFANANMRSLGAPNRIGSQAVPAGAEMVRHAGENVNLSAYPGRNKTERGMNYLRTLANKAGIERSHDDLWADACRLINAG